MKEFFGKALYRSMFLAGYLVSLLPMGVLYTLSSLAYLVIYYIFPYRKLVVVQNLSRAFPYKKYPEIESISKQFYRSFTDYFAEIIKTISISKQKMQEKIELVNPGLINMYFSKGRSVFMLLGHCGNWEMLNILPTLLKCNTYATYKPLKNKAINALMYALRSRFGMKLIPDKSIVRHIISNKNNPSLYFFIADQCPVKVNKKYTVSFLNQDTNMFAGAEKLSRITNSAVVYLHITQVSRGNYKIQFVPVCDESTKTTEAEITKTYARLLEANITEEPFGWLWTHKRWKR